MVVLVCLSVLKCCEKGGAMACVCKHIRSTVKCGDELCEWGSGVC
jgi:hypothetical protein